MAGEESARDRERGGREERRRKITSRSGWSKQSGSSIRFAFSIIGKSTFGTTCS